MQFLVANAALRRILSCAAMDNNAAQDYMATVQGNAYQMTKHAIRPDGVAMVPSVRMLAQHAVVPPVYQLASRASPPQSPVFSAAPALPVVPITSVFRMAVDVHRKGKRVAA